MNRKAFIHQLGRVSILGGMGLLLALLLKNRKITLYSECSEDLKCSSCRSLSRCSLPEGLKAKAHGKG